MIYAKLGVNALKKILNRTNILLINENELKILFEEYYSKFDALSENETLSFRDLAIHILDDGIDTVVVKRGINGVYAINHESEVKIPAFKVDAVDTTCAGDSFNAGFLYSYIKEYSLEKSCTIGNWVASKSVESIGISSLPNLEELNAFINDLDC